ncbi:MAG: hypothetical protein JJT94_04530 [Bernardetiaceae bacterium]|nr:hypothetical protein [Bernardetiaceae bacterium]
MQKKLFYTLAILMLILVSVRPLQSQDDNQNSELSLEQKLKVCQQQLEKLRADNKLLEDKAQNAQNLKDNKEEEEDAYQITVQNLLLSMNFWSEGNNYDTLKTQQLLAMLEHHKVNLEEIAEVSQKLKNFLILAKIMTQAQEALALPYEKQNVSKIIQKLAKAKGYNALQNTDIEVKRQLLANYCNREALAAASVEVANSWLPDLPQEVRQELDKTLFNIDMQYRYLRKEIEKKQKNPEYQPKFKTSCN